MYNQEVKKHCRTRLIKHAIKSLTTDRDTSVCVKRDHVRRVWQQLHETGEATMFFDPPLRKKIEEEIEKWEILHDSQVQTRKPSDLRVCYLCGDNPINDLEVFVENGVLCKNVWAIEKDNKVLEKAWQNVAESNMRNIRLFKGDLITCLKDLEGQFDIIYFDACGTLPSAKQRTLETIGCIFLCNKLTSPGALITNFSFPPEDTEGAVTCNNSQVSERDSLEHMATEYLQYRLWNTILRDGCANFEELRERKIDSRSVDDNCGDYITYQVIDSAYLYIPAYRMLTSEKQSLWDQLFVKKGKFLNEVKDPEKLASLLQGEDDLYLQQLAETMEDCNSCPPCKTWVEEIFPDLKSSSREIKNEKLAFLILTHLLSHNGTFLIKFGNSYLQERSKEGFNNSAKFSFCDNFDVPSFLGLVMGLLYGQVAYPSFCVLNKTLRLKYTAKTRQMFSDVLIFDKCRYLYENFPSVHFSEFAMKELWQQMVFRMVADGLRKHIAHVYNDMFKYCNVASLYAPSEGGTDFSADSHFSIPDREVLDFKYFKENGKSLFKAEEFAAASKCYDACLELNPESAEAATIYTNKAVVAFKMNQTQEILANCEKALELEPNKTKALFWQAMAWKELKQYGDAMKNLEKILSIEEDHSDAKRELEIIMTLLNT